jgi:hypothetical protein
MKLIVIASYFAGRRARNGGMRASLSARRPERARMIGQATSEDCFVPQTAAVALAARLA